MEAVAGASKISAVTPEASFGSCAEPTLTPATSVMRLRIATPFELKRSAKFHRISLEWRDSGPEGGTEKE